MAELAVGQFDDTLGSRLYAIRSESMGEWPLPARRSKYMSQAWFYKSRGQIGGPISAEELRKKASAGELTREDAVRKGADGKWVAASRVTGLFAPDVPRPSPVHSGQPKSSASKHFVAVECAKCGARLEIDDDGATFECQYCGALHEREYSGANPTPHSLRTMAERALARDEYGKAMQFVEQGLLIDPRNRDLVNLEDNLRQKLSSLAARQQIETSGQIEADQYCLQAQFILAELQANLEVYGSNSTFSCPSPANIDLALQYIDRSLELFPDGIGYLNVKALLLWQGKERTAEATALLERAAALNPRDINIQNNLKSITSPPSSCFIATAAFGTPLAMEVVALRKWRDQRLAGRRWGECLIAVYAFVSPPLAKWIAPRPRHRMVIRWMIESVVMRMSKSRSTRR